MTVRSRVAYLKCTPYENWYPLSAFSSFFTSHSQKKKRSSHTKQYEKILLPVSLPEHSWINQPIPHRILRSAKSESQRSFESKSQDPAEWETLVHAPAAPLFLLLFFSFRRVAARSDLPHELKFEAAGTSARFRISAIRDTLILRYRIPRIYAHFDVVGVRNPPRTLFIFLRQPRVAYRRFLSRETALVECVLRFC